MSEAWVIDAVRPPRGRGKNATGARPDVATDESLDCLCASGPQAPHAPIIPLEVMGDCAMGHDPVDVDGGAIARGHPLDATGGMLRGPARDELERRDETSGLVTPGIDGVMGTSTLFERI